MNKDWIGNKKSTFTTLGASSHVKHEREKHDYYATEPSAIDALFQHQEFSGLIWEPACGEGHLSKRMLELGGRVQSTDIIDRGYGDGEVDFLACTEPWNGHIITNPPYKYAQEFVEKSLSLIPNGYKVAMFLRLTFLEGQKRRKMFERYPPKDVLVFSARKKCAINGEFENTGSSAACYAWFVWEKGVNVNPLVSWI